MLKILKTEYVFTTSRMSSMFEILLINLSTSASLVFLQGTFFFPYSVECQICKNIGSLGVFYAFYDISNIHNSENSTIITIVLIRTLKRSSFPYTRVGTFEKPD
jgi:hypothetical protein